MLLVALVHCHHAAIRSLSHHYSIIAFYLHFIASLKINSSILDSETVVVRIILLLLIIIIIQTLSLRSYNLNTSTEAIILSTCYRCYSFVNLVMILIYSYSYSISNKTDAFDCSIGQLKPSITRPQHQQHAAVASSCHRHAYQRKHNI